MNTALFDDGAPGKENADDEWEYDHSKTPAKGPTPAASTPFKGCSRLNEMPRLAPSPSAPHQEVSSFPDNENASNCDSTDSDDSDDFFTSNTEQTVEHISEVFRKRTQTLEDPNMFRVLNTVGKNCDETPSKLVKPPLPTRLSYGAQRTPRIYTGLESPIQRHAKDRPPKPAYGSLQPIPDCSTEFSSAAQEESFALFRDVAEEYIENFGGFKYSAEKHEILPNECDDHGPEVHGSIQTFSLGMRATRVPFLYSISVDIEGEAVGNIELSMNRSESVNMFLRIDTPPIPVNKVEGDTATLSFWAAPSASGVDAKASLTLDVDGCSRDFLVTMIGAPPSLDISLSYVSNGIEDIPLSGNKFTFDSNQGRTEGRIELSNITSEEASMLVSASVSDDAEDAFQLVENGKLVSKLALIVLPDTPVSLDVCCCDSERKPDSDGVSGYVKICVASFIPSPSSSSKEVDPDLFQPYDQLIEVQRRETGFVSSGSDGIPSPSSGCDAHFFERPISGVTEAENEDGQQPYELDKSIDVPDTFPHFPDENTVTINDQCHNIEDLIEDCQQSYTDALVEKYLDEVSHSVSPHRTPYSVQPSRSAIAGMQAEDSDLRVPTNITDALEIHGLDTPVASRELMDLSPPQSRSAVRPKGHVSPATRSNDASAILCLESSGFEKSNPRNTRVYETPARACSSIVRRDESDGTPTKPSTKRKPRLRFSKELVQQKGICIFKDEANTSIRVQNPCERALNITVQVSKSIRDMIRIDSDQVHVKPDESLSIDLRRTSGGEGHGKLYITCKEEDDEYTRKTYGFTVEVEARLCGFFSDRSVVGFYGCFNHGNKVNFLTQHVCIYNGSSERAQFQATLVECCSKIGNEACPMELSTFRLGDVPKTVAPFAHVIVPVHFVIHDDSSHECYASLELQIGSLELVRIPVFGYTGTAEMSAEYGESATEIVIKNSGPRGGVCLIQNEGYNVNVGLLVASQDEMVVDVSESLLKGAQQCSITFVDEVIASHRDRDCGDLPEMDGLEEKVASFTSSEELGRVVDDVVFDACVQAGYLCTVEEYEEDGDNEGGGKGTCIKLNYFEPDEKDLWNVVQCDGKVRICNYSADNALEFSGAGLDCSCGSVPPLGEGVVQATTTDAYIVVAGRRLECAELLEVNAMERA